MQLSLPRFFDRNSNTDTRPYRLGICLSGGGARGFAHIGALKAITEVGLQPDIIAGGCHTFLSRCAARRSRTLVR